jgi:hypothetical protein
VTATAGTSIERYSHRCTIAFFRNRFTEEFVEPYVALMDGEQEPVDEYVGMEKEYGIRHTGIVPCNTGGEGDEDNGNQDKNIDPENDTGSMWRTTWNWRWWPSQNRASTRKAMMEMKTCGMSLSIIPGRTVPATDSCGRGGAIPGPRSVITMAKIPSTSVTSRFFGIWYSSPSSRPVVVAC